jgi:hypothetical protein
LSIEAVKAVIMDRRMSGLCIGGTPAPASFAVYVISTINETLHIVCQICSSLGGIHGIPRVHYKGRQGDYYVMVCKAFRHEDLC